MISYIDMAMVSSRLLFFLSAILILIVQAIAQLPLLSYYCLNDNGNYTNNSIYETNLNQLLSSTPTQKLIMASIIPLMAKTPMKYMQLDFVEEILSQMFVVVALRTLRKISHGSVPIKRKQ
jgi:hypothetical protein